MSFFLCRLRVKKNAENVNTGQWQRHISIMDTVFAPFDLPNEINLDLNVEAQMPSLATTTNPSKTNEHNGKFEI